jgi:hypothetical protein
LCGLGRVKDLPNLGYGGCKVKELS